MKTHRGKNFGCLMVAEYEDDGAASLGELLKAMEGSRLPSKTGSRVYTVKAVTDGKSVTLSGKDRHDSILKWDAIALVYARSAGEKLTTTRVDEILREHPATHNSSTMCALVLAMRDPRRIIR